MILDVEGYRSRRKEALERLAARSPIGCVTPARRCALEPMSPHERKVIHVALQQEKGITTFSEGEEPYRKVYCSAGLTGKESDNREGSGAR